MHRVADKVNGALPTTKAATYLGVERKHLAKLPIPRADLSAPGSGRATWVYRVADLDAYLEKQLVQPGH